MNSILTEYDEEQVLADVGRENYEEGRQAGREEGRSSGLKEGRSSGLKEGRSVGLKEGIKTGIRAGINALIMDNAEDGKSKEQILEKLVKHFSLEYDEAQKYYDTYVKNANK